MKCLHLVVLGILSLGVCGNGTILSAELTEFNQKNNRYFTVNNDTLIAAHVIFRHGARNINPTFRKDPYRDEIHWPDGGIGQLTKVGKQQQYKLGQYFRRRYGSLLGADKKYSPKKVYIQSTDIDRTLMSAQANLAGLYVPTADEMWNNEILWQPIPVHTVPKKMDYVLYTIVDCPKYTALRDAYLLESKEVQRIFTEYADTFSFLSQKTGENITTMYDIYEIYDALNIERQHNKSLPKWAMEAIQPNGIVEYIARYDFKTYTDTPQMARLISGSLIKEIIQHISEKITNSTQYPDRSLWLYSGHDFTIANVLNALGLYEVPHIPPFASSLHFELFKTQDNEHYLQIFYRKSGEEDLKPMHIPHCGEKCSLEHFEEIYREIIPVDFHAECKWN